MPKKIFKDMKGFNPFGDLVGLKFTKWEEGYSHCVLTVNDNHMNPHKTVHGGVIYAMADSGMGATMYTVMSGEELCASIEIKIAYFKAVRSGILTCDTKLIHMGNRIATLESEISNEGTLVAKAIGTFLIFIPSSGANK